MYGYRVSLELTNHERIEGKPITTLSKNKQEFLLMETKDAKQEIEMSQIKSMQALAKNPHFDRIDF